MMDPISILIYLLIFVLILGLIWWAGNALGIPQQVLIMVLIVAVVLLALWMLRAIGLP